MPEPQQDDKKHVRVFGPDNKYYQFPAGTTKDAAVAFFKKRGITSPETKPAAPQAAPQQTGVPAPQGPPTIGQKMDVEAEREQGMVSRYRPRWDDPAKVLRDPPWLGSFRYLGGELFGGARAGATIAVGGAKLIHDIASALDPIEGYKRPLGDPQLQVGKDVVDIGKGILDIGKASWDMLKHFPESMGDPDKFGNHITNVAAVVDGGIKLSKAVAEGLAKSPGAKVNPTEAVSKAHEVTSGTPSRLLHRKAFEEAYVHSKGLDVAKKISKAAKAVQDEVKAHAEGIASQIDGKIPTGVIDAGAEAKTIMQEFQDVVKTPDKAHPVLVQMVKDAQATAPKMWTWEKARQFRTSVGRAWGQVKGPQEVVLAKVYKDLTNKLGSTAKQYGLENSWKKYNELASKMDKEFADTVDGVRDAQSGQEVAQRLTKDTALTSELSRNLSKYGLNHAEVLDFVKTAQRVLRNKGFWNKTLFRLAYGSPTGAPTMILMRMAGAPWMVGLGAGAIVGLASSYLVNMARALRLSPEVIEHMMKDRELPGPSKVDKGVFPDEGAKTLPEGEPPKTPPQLPAPSEDVIEQARRTRGAGTKEPMEDQVQKARDKIATDKEAKRLEWEKKQQEARAAKAPEVKKVEPEQHGTGKLADQAKARERITKNRGTAKRTKEAQAQEAQARAQATGLDVSQLQIPEMEEFVRTKNPTAYSGLQKLRKSKGITDEMYSEALKYYILEHLEK
jgi:hypothetical protein